MHRHRHRHTYHRLTCFRLCMCFLHVACQVPPSPSCLLSTINCGSPKFFQPLHLIAVSLPLLTLHALLPFHAASQRPSHLEHVQLRLNSRPVSLKTQPLKWLLSPRPLFRFIHSASFQSLLSPLEALHDPTWALYQFRPASTSKTCCPNSTPRRRSLCSPASTFGTLLQFTAWVSPQSASQTAPMASVAPASSTVSRPHACLVVSLPFLLSTPLPDPDKEPASRQHGTPISSNKEELYKVSKPSPRVPRSS